MPALDTILQQKLQQLDEQKARRSPIASLRGKKAQVEKAKNALISFACNDYLGLSQHPDVVANAKEAIEKYGAGAGASRLITGNNEQYDELEGLLAKHKKTDAACVFGSGYLANLGIIPALAGKKDVIFADKLSHACLLDGAKLSSATLLRFAHNDLEHLANLLKTNRHKYDKCLFLSEAIFSMDGDRAPINELAQMAKENDGSLMIDHAHSLFADEEFPDDIIHMGTLSKAIGSYGGYVCGSQILIDYIKTTARSLIYSTALPPATLAASIAALRIIEADKNLCEIPLNHARYFTKLLDLPQAQSAIVPVVFGSNEKVLQAAKILEEKGFWVSSIRPPTVPENTARLRITFSAAHDKSQIEQLAAIIKSEGWL